MQLFKTALICLGRQFWAVARNLHACFIFTCIGIWIIVSLVLANQRPRVFAHYYAYHSALVACKPVGPIVGNGAKEEKVVWWICWSNC